MRGGVNLDALLECIRELGDHREALPLYVQNDIERLIQEARTFRRANRSTLLRMAGNIAAGIAGERETSPHGSPSRQWLQNAADVAGRARAVAWEIMQQEDADTEKP